MADVHSLVRLTGVATGLGNTISQKMLEFLNNVRDQPIGFRDLGLEFLSICQILNSLDGSLKEHFQTNQPFPQQATSELTKVLVKTADDFSELQALLQKFMDYEKGGTFARLQKTWRLVFADKDIAKIRGSLQANRGSLTMAMLLTNINPTPQPGPVGYQYELLASKLHSAQGAPSPYTEYPANPPNLGGSTHFQYQDPSLSGFGGATAYQSHGGHTLQHHTPGVSGPGSASTHWPTPSPPPYGTPSGPWIPVSQKMQTPPISQLSITDSVPQPSVVSSVSAPHQKIPPVAEKPAIPHQPVVIKVDRFQIPRRSPRQPAGSTEALEKTLVSAIDGGKPHIVEQLLDRGVNPDMNQNVAIVRAINGRNIPILTLLLEFGADPNRKDEHGETPLRYACEWNYEPEAKLLLDYGADPNLPGADFVPIAWACDHQNVVSIVRLLLSYGADPNITYPNGHNTIVYAAERCSVSVLEVLLEYGADMNAKTKSGQTAVAAAVQGNQVDNLKFLLSRGADVHAYQGILELAVWHNQMDCVKVLVEAGVDINEKRENCTPLATAVRDNHPEILSYLMSKGADVNLEGPEIPLKMALDKPPLLKQLLAAGADAKKYKGLMELATWENNLESVKILFQAGVSVDEKHQDIYTPLTTSIRDDHPDIFEFLISKGADPNLEGEDYPICRALSRPEYLYKLVSAGAKPRNYKGILELAVYHGVRESVEFLIEVGVDLNEKHHELYSPITTAIRDNHAETLSILLSSGADPNTPGEDLPVIQAAGNEDITFLQKLIDAGVDVNKEHSGTYALHRACESNFVQHVGLLLRHGADVNKTSWDGSTALDVAAREGHDDIVMLLLDGGK